MSPVAVLIFVLSAGVLHAGDLFVPPSSSSTTVIGQDQTTVHWPFGSIELAGAKRPAVELPAQGAVRALTRGTFHLRYELMKRDGVITPRTLRVTVHNRPEFHGPPTERLREHESGHIAINKNEVLRLEKELRAFRVEGVSLAQAEKQLREKFQREMGVTRRLHAEWDNTHVFVSSGGPPPPAGEPAGVSPQPK